MNNIISYFILGFIALLIFINLLIFSSCVPNNLGLAPIIGSGAGGLNNQLPLFSIGTYKMNTTNSSVRPEVSFGYFNYTTKPFAFVNLNPTNNTFIPVSFGNSNFPNQGNKVLVLGTAFAGGDSNPGTDRDIFWVGKILDPNNNNQWVDTITVSNSNQSYIVVKGTNFIARFNYNFNSFNSTFDTMRVRKNDNTNNYTLVDFQNIDQDFRSIAFIKGGTANITGYYGVLVGRNCAFSCTNTVDNGNNFRNLYGLTNSPSGNGYVWQDVIPFDEDPQNGLLIGHRIIENTGSAVIKVFDSSSGTWSSNFGIGGSVVEPFYSSDYITLLSNNSILKVAFIAGKKTLFGYINTPPNQKRFDLNKLEAIDLVNNRFSNVAFYGVTVLRDNNDNNYNVSGVAVGYDFSSSSPIVLKFQRTGNPPNPNPNYPINPNYNLTRVDISNLNLGKDVVLLDVNNVLINGVNYVYIVGIDLTNCPIKPYPSGTMPPFTKSLVFPAYAPFTTTTSNVINTLNNMRGVLLYSNNGGNSFTLLGSSFITP